MSELLKTVLSLSLSGTLLFFVIQALKPLYKNKLSKRWQYYIWLIVVVRMLLPFTLETTLVGSAFQHLDNINLETPPTVNDTQSDFSLDDSYIAPKANIDTTPSISIQAIFSKAYKSLWILWVVIAFALLIRKVTMYQSFVRFVKAGRAEVSDIEILNTLADVGEMIGVERPVELFINPLISSPMLLGFFRPYIILPIIELEKTELTYIMRHELTHYKHFDMFYKWLVQITLCLHWFNPFAYLLTKEINKGCELSCDEAIIKTMNKDEKKIYGDTLLNALKAMGHYNDQLATVTLTEGSEQLKERLDAIMKFKEKSNLVVVMTLILTATLCMGAMAVGAYAAPANQTSVTPWEAIGETGQPYTYSQQGYYQGEYIFELGWNLNAKSYDAYADKAKVTLSDNSTITVSFDKSCKSESQNNSVLTDLEELVERLKKQYANSTTPLEKPLVVSVEYIGDNELVKLADEYYINGKLTRFYSIFSSLDKDIQKEYCTKMIEDSKNTFLSSAAKSMESDVMNFCLEKTYQEGKLTLFASIVPYLTDNQKEKWVARASHDRKNTFLAVLTQQASIPRSIQGDGSVNKKSMRQESLIISFAPFRSYGLVYNVKQDRAFFNGQEVKAFVDIRDMFPGGTYSFNLGYIEPDSNSTLYLMAVRDENGSVTGIQEMSKELQNDLYDIHDKTSSSEPYIPELDDEIKDNMLEILGGEGGYSVHDQKYIVFDATTNLNNSSITATDKLSSTNIPKTISDWILTCQGSDQVNVKRTTKGGKVDAWIYYHSDIRMAWNMSVDGTALKFVMTDNTPKFVSGATLIHYQAPEAYQNLEVFFKSEKLEINVQ